MRSSELVKKGVGMNTAIEFKHIKKAYGEKVVMDNFNLAVEKGEFVTIIGSSGCGKRRPLKWSTA